VGLLQGEVLIKGEARQGLISDDDTSDKLKVGLVFQVGLGLGLDYPGWSLACLLVCFPAHLLAWRAGLGGAGLGRNALRVISLVWALTGPADPTLPPPALGPACSPLPAERCAV
jgi:hypothetical protein